MYVEQILRPKLNKTICKTKLIHEYNYSAYNCQQQVSDLDTEQNSSTHTVFAWKLTASLAWQEEWRASCNEFQSR